MLFSIFSCDRQIHLPNFNLRLTPLLLILLWHQTLHELALRYSVLKARYPYTPLLPGLGAQYHDSVFNCDLKGVSKRWWFDLEGRTVLVHTDHRFDMSQLHLSVGLLTHSIRVMVLEYQSSPVKVDYHEPFMVKLLKQLILVGLLL